MQRRNPGRTTSVSIAPNSVFSLTGAGWICRSKESWDEKHHDFFAKNDLFYKNTITRSAGFYHVQSKSGPNIVDRSEWILEANDGQMHARLFLQVISGDFKHGILIFDLEDQNFAFNVRDAIAQLITSNFLALRLDTQKVIPFSETAVQCLDYLFANRCENLINFNREWLPDVKIQPAYQIDQETWLKTEVCKKSLNSLSWLKKRVERESATKARVNSEKKRPWFLSLLTVGRNRKQSGKMIHPLEEFRGSTFR